MDEREIERQEKVLDQVEQMILDTQLSELIKLAKHCHGLKDTEALSRAMGALLEEPEEEAEAA
jgi:hypothetical protein